MEKKNSPDLYGKYSWGARIADFSDMLKNLMGTHSWNPAINLRENGNELILSADIPGFDPRDLDIAVNGDTVILKGHSRQEETRDQPGYYFATRSQHSFYQEIPLPERVKSEQTMARYNDGVLELKMMKGKSFVRGYKPLVASGDHPLLD